MTDFDANMICDKLRQIALEHGMLINFGSEKFQCKKVAERL